MGWEKPETNTISFREKPVGSVYEGTFQGGRLVKTSASDKPVSIWSFMDEEDNPFEVWGFASLNFPLEHVKTGSKCRITYLGKSETKNRYGKYSYLSKVEVWKNDDDSLGQ